MDGPLAPLPELEQNDVRQRIARNEVPIENL